KRFGGRKIWLLNVVLILIPVAYFGYRPLLRYSVFAIISNRQPTKSDAIVLLSGGEPGRAWGAADVYKEKFAPNVVLSREPPGSDVLELRNLGVPFATNFDQNTGVLRGLGVPENA